VLYLDLGGLKWGEPRKINRAGIRAKENSKAGFKKFGSEPLLTATMI
jgi:hypothetical protein